MKHIHTLAHTGDIRMVRVGYHKDAVSRADTTHEKHTLSHIHIVRVGVYKDAILNRLNR